MRSILLEDTLKNLPETDHIKLQIDSLEVDLITNGSVYEHCSTICFGLIIAYLISTLTQIYKDKDRY